jgi:hypothetical protein
MESVEKHQKRDADRESRAYPRDTVLNRRWGLSTMVVGRTKAGEDPAKRTRLGRKLDKEEVETMLFITVPGTVQYDACSSFHSCALFESSGLYLRLILTRY